MAHVENKERVRGRTRFQKMIFVLQHQIKNFKDKYDFIPHDYGPYSRELQDDIDNLIEKELLIEVCNTIEEGKIKYVYQITKKGESLVQSILDDSDLEKKFRFNRIADIASRIKHDLNRKHLPTLLTDIYEQYPDFSKHSVFHF